MDVDGPLPDPSPWHPETDPARLKVLGKLLEELGEGVSAAARCIIQGIDEVEPVTKKPNRLWFEDELADILANVKHAVEHFQLDLGRIHHRRDRKFAYISRWLAGLTRPIEPSAAAGFQPTLRPAATYEAARELVIREQNPSTSFVQRKLQVGYNQASSYIERMQAEGVCGPISRNGQRKMLMAGPA